MIGGLLLDDPSLAWRFVATVAVGTVVTVVALAAVAFGHDAVTAIVSGVERGRDGN